MASGLKSISLERLLLLRLGAPLVALVVVVVSIGKALETIERLDEMDLRLADAAVAAGIGMVPAVQGPLAVTPSVSPGTRESLIVSVRNAEGTLIAGDAMLHPDPERRDDPVLANATQRVFYEVRRDGERLRAVQLRTRLGGQPALLLAGESMRSRDRLIIEAVVQVLALATLMALCAGALIHVNVRLALRPLTEVVDVLARSPLEGVNRTGIRVREIEPLVQRLDWLFTRLLTTWGQRRAFIADAAHQLRTPIAGIIVQLDNARSDLEPGAARDHVERAAQAASRLSRLVNQLLSLTSAEEGGRKASERVRCDLRECIVPRVDEWVRRAATARIDIGFELEAVQVEADALLLGEGIANLVDNALRYCPSGSQVTVRCGQQDALAWVEVEDDGPGIAPAERERAFERFWRGAAAQVQTAGSGLGLAIVREIAARHQGNVELGDRQGRGLRVRLTLPVAAEPDPRGSAAA